MGKKPKYNRTRLKRHDKQMKFKPGTDPKRDITGKVRKR